MRRGSPCPERGGGVLAPSPGRCGNRLRRIARAFGCAARGRAWPIDRGQHRRIGVVLPIGLPWVGSHFRLDALSAFFLVVINLGAAAASLYGLGHSRHEQEPQRVLPFFPAFLAGMNLVLLADDAFTFLASWEFMSLASWALVMARHQEADNARAGYVYIVMASLGHDGLAAGVRTAGGTARRLRVRHDARERRDAGRRRSCARSRAHRRGIEGGTGSAPCLAAARASRRAKPRLRSDERSDDQGRDLRLRPDRFRSAWASPPGGGASWCSRSEASRRSWASSTR